MQHFSKKVYKLLEKLNIKKCTKKEATFISEPMPPFIEELLLKFDWPEDYNFIIKKTTW